MRTTIRTRILFIFVGVFAIQTLLVGSFILYQHNSTRKNWVRQELQTTADNISSQVHFFFQTVLHDLDTAGQQIERIAQKDYQRHHLLNTLKNNNPAFKALAFYDINGIVKSAVSSENHWDVHDFFSDHSTLFSFPYDTDAPHVTSIQSLTNETVIAMSQPVSFLDDAYTIGVISALVPLNSMQPILDRTNIPEHQDILVLDSNDKVIARKLKSSSIPSSFSSGMNWQDEVVINSIRYISSSVQFDFHGELFTVVSLVRINNSIAPSGSSFMLLVFLILLLLLLSTIVAWTTNKKIIEPLQILAKASATMARGENVVLDTTNDAELQDVSKALQTMNMQLRTSNDSLKDEISKRRREERNAIMAKMEAERLNQAKSIFLANMSHEIRTPLHSILGMLKMIKKDPLSAEQVKLLTMTSVAGEHLQNTVNTILDLSQIESGKFELQQYSFSLSELLREVTGLMYLQANEKNITIIHTLSPDIPDRLQGDSGRIRQILINLLGNAIKFSDQGTINIEVEHLGTGDEDAAELLFKVTDCGHGISENDIDNIFDAFERGKNESNNIIEGTGLGLTISNEFVQHMGGKLWLKQTGPEGSTFCFTIQCALAKDESDAINEEEENSLTDSPLSGIRVMLAEDEFINQRIIAAYLEEMGAQVTVCQHGQELLDKMKEEEADIILMDIRMPVMNGLEATKRIRNSEEGSAQLAIPIVALTAQATTDFELKCREAGMNDYLTKPVPFGRLVKIIRELVI